MYRIGTFRFCYAVTKENNYLACFHWILRHDCPLGFFSEPFGVGFRPHPNDSAYPYDFWTYPNGFSLDSSPKIYDCFLYTSFYLLHHSGSLLENECFWG